MTAAQKKAITAQLRELRRTWKIWSLQLPGLHPGQDLTCHHRAPEPHCEGCMATAYRADHRADIEAEGFALNARLAEGTTP